MSLSASALSSSRAAPTSTSTSTSTSSSTSSSSRSSLSVSVGVDPAADPAPAPAPAPSIDIPIPIPIPIPVAPPLPVSWSSRSQPSAPAHRSQPQLKPFKPKHAANNKTQTVSLSTPTPSASKSKSPSKSPSVVVSSPSSPLTSPGFPADIFGSSSIRVIVPTLISVQPAAAVSSTPTPCHDVHVPAPSWCTSDRTNIQAPTRPTVEQERTWYQHDPEWPAYDHIRTLGHAIMDGTLRTTVWNEFDNMCHLQPNKRAIIWIDQHGKTQREITYGQMHIQIRQIAYHITQIPGLSRGCRVLLCFVPGLDFFLSFWACMSLGLIAVPVCPADPFHPHNDIADKLSAIVRDCEPSLFLTTRDYISALDAARVYHANKQTDTTRVGFDIFTTKWVCVDSMDSNFPADFIQPVFKSSPSDLAFLQYTSGSTGNPKGVMVTQHALMMNVSQCITMTASASTFAAYKSTIGISWLPTFHDMGLVGFHITPMLIGGTCVYFSPLDFVSDPMLWLRTITEWTHNGTYTKCLTGAPPFALGLLARKATDREVSELKLEGIQALMVGAEPITYHALDSFSSRFKACGFNPRSYMTAYGMAENVLHAMGKKDNTYPPTSIYVSSCALQRGVIEEFSAGAAGGQWLVSSADRDLPYRGFIPVVPQDATVLCVDVTTCSEVADGHVGELWIYSQSMAAGYWNNQQATTKTFHAQLSKVVREESQPYLDKKFIRSGDLGVFWKGQLYVTGRLKDMIILNGTNLYPHDIEEAVKTAHTDIRAGGVVAFPTQTEHGERLGILVELRSRTPTASITSIPRSARIAASILNASQSLPDSVRGRVMRVAITLARWMGQCTRKNKSEEKQDKQQQGPYSPSELQSMTRAVRRCIMLKFGQVATRVVICQAHTVLKTSSGKIRHAATAQALMMGKLDDKILKNDIIVPKPTIKEQQQQKIGSAISQAVEAPTTTPNPSRPPLDLDDIKTRIISILSAELSMDASTVACASETFVFDESVSLEEYGIDSMTAMKLASKISLEFDLKVPISPFMLASEPTIQGLSKLIQKLHQATPPSILPSVHLRSQLANTAIGGAPTNSTPPCILGIGRVVPGTGGPQSVIIKGMIAGMKLPQKQAKLFAQIGAASGIETRYSVLKSLDEMYWGKTGLGNDECVEVRNAVFKSEAPPLSMASAQQAIQDWGGDKSRITHVVAVTCTGVIVPGLEFHVMSGLGLSTDVQRLGVTFMGCFGALSGMKAARAFACENPNNRVLVVCTELCSLHMQLNDAIDNMVGSSLFSDGSGALIIGCNPTPDETPIYELHNNASLIIPGTLDQMGWDLRNSGMSIVLSREIPESIYQNIGEFTANMIAMSPMSAQYQGQIHMKQLTWALHPGGPMILQAIADCLGLDRGDTWASWEILRRYGNMSSATLIFVLDELRNKKKQGDTSTVDGSEWLAALAFGPGLNVEGAMLRMC